jgi:hypothetical protein
MMTTQRICRELSALCLSLLLLLSALPVNALGKSGLTKLHPFAASSAKSLNTVALGSANNSGTALHPADV